jgi:hypothetical protein
MGIALIRIGVIITALGLNILKERLEDYNGVFFKRRIEAIG